MNVGDEVLRMTIFGKPRTKKNSQQIIEIGRRCPVCRRGQRSKVIPSAAYTLWWSDAMQQVTDYYAVGGGDPPRVRGTLNLEAHYYRHQRRGDLINFHEALCDLLEDAGVVDDDRWIVATDGSTLEHDTERPRIEFVLTVIEDTGHAVAGR